ncbi:4-(cytidine 5'-diphospho)-2-C-methyl-D-erythritol kinase [Intestinimonas butyriciproducens]|uniref:4-(cytidine 5'-diphospho)-2-C-methyl-D-erythritol kinase n=1 Tax=Intestinimonas butyriciproducens TaxID=1297617 RepID=UPI0019594E39|nr:4-(cytidine 5'-diphospho)-2-C-methyl-D-erythritol kinase [Intestinimonas butyriciproducens]MBM6975424.1 4-(cytidine 5'-diphospho)-2-C-methyl-D-erythritol kinase [Intestinimonas butyriciproducens]
MPKETVLARAKLNLTLDVLGKRPDGYHDLKMVMQSVALADTLTVETGTGEGLEVRTDLSFLPNNEKNLAAAAALAFQTVTGRDLGGVAIAIEKRIPVCAGMGGGSSDAAAVLRSLERMLGTGQDLAALARIGERVGSDVPYCVLGGTALAEGRGEVLTPLSALPHCRVVICKPAFSISTPELFRAVDGVRLRCRPDTDGVLAALEAGDLGGVARRMYNVFEDALPSRQRTEVAAIRSALVQHGALGANMSGTGPTVFGLFDDADRARSAWEELRQTYRDVFLTETVEQ